MSESGTTSSISGMLEEIINFIGTTKGLKVVTNGQQIELTQEIDHRSIVLGLSTLEQVLSRQDQEGRPFLQLNLNGSRKILLTDQLIGFKPMPTPGLDLNKLPKVVTTPDLISVLEAIEESFAASDFTGKETEMLKKAYFSIIRGAEQIGFTMNPEKEWLIRLIASTNQKAS